MTARVQEASEAELVELAREGSAAAFEEIYDRHAPGIARTLASFAGPDRDLLDDLIQDVFLRVVDKLESYVPSHPFPSWLYTIALNVGRSHARRSSRIIPVNPAELHALRDASGDVSSGSDPPRDATLLRLVARLPLAMREVVSLRVGSDLTYREIGAMLDIPEGTARRRMHNAIRTLRDQWDEGDLPRSMEK